MAEATLNDVTKLLRTSNLEQRTTTGAVSELTGRFDEFLKAMERQRLDALENKIEANRAVRENQEESRQRADNGDFGGLGTLGRLLGLGALGTALATVGATVTAFVGAVEGLGPIGRDLERFKQALSSYKSIIVPFGNLTAPFENLKTNLLRYFGIGADGKNILLRDAAGKFASVPPWRQTIRSWIRWTDKFSDFIKGIKLPESITKFFSAEGKGTSVLEAVKNNRWVNTFLKIMRPIAVILSAFDGLENAQAEMEDREGLFSKWVGGGIGGFLSGTAGSFFGEFFNLVKAAPLWIIKQFVPAEWLNEDGTFDTSENIFTKVLGGIELIDFNKLITEIVQKPFDLLGNALDFVRNLFGATGTTEEGQLRAKAAWDTWWKNWTSLAGIGSNIAGVWDLIANTVFFPITALFKELGRAFDISEEDIKAYVANKLPKSVSEFLGLGDYVGLNASEFSTAAAELNKKVLDLNSEIVKWQNQASAESDPIAQQYYLDALEAARSDLTQAKSDYDLLTQQAARGGVSQQTINTANNTFETNYFPTAGTGDGNDPLRVK